MPCGHCHPCNKGAPRHVWCGGYWLGKLSTIPCQHPWRWCLISTSAELLKRPGRQGRSLLEGLWPRRNVRVNGLLQLPTLLLLDPRSQADAQARCPLCLLSGSLARPRALSRPLKMGLHSRCSGHRMGRNHHGSSVLPQTLKQKMEIRLMKIKFLLKKNCRRQKEELPPSWFPKA